MFSFSHMYFGFNMEAIKKPSSYAKTIEVLKDRSDSVQGHHPPPRDDLVGFRKLSVKLKIFIEITV